MIAVRVSMTVQRGAPKSPKYETCSMNEPWMPVVGGAVAVPVVPVMTVRTAMTSATAP